MKKHLVYDLYGAHLDSNEIRHAQIVVKELGITYQHSTPQSMNDTWMFWNCENVPEQLPPYLKVKDLDPMEWIGYGLSKENAIAIQEGQNA